MNRTCICIPIMLIGVLALSSVAQVSGQASQAPTSATIAGLVIKDPGSEPVKKAVIELIADDQQQCGNYTTVTGIDGNFRIEGVAPGRYHLFAERVGYVESTNRGGRSQGRILTLVAGQDLKDIQIRFAAAATVTGRVTDEDGDPLENAGVNVLRRTFSHGQSHLQQVASERTNDLGEYRVFGLAAGNYYVSVNPPPDFKSLIDSEKSPPSGKQSASKSDEKPSNSYQTTYYPGTPDRGQAQPIQLHAGDEFPANFSLSPSPTITVRGSVMNLTPGSSATVMLQSSEFSVIYNGAEVHKDGSFAIRDVSPGAYTIIASVDNASVPMIARLSLQAGSNNIDSVRLMPQAGATIRGRLHLEQSAADSFTDPGQMSLVLRPADAEDDAVMGFMLASGFSSAAQVATDGTFQWTNVPAGNYFVVLSGGRGGSGNWFVKSFSTGGRPGDSSSISVSGGVITLDVTASANGGILEGIVTDSQGASLPDGVIVAVPEAPQRSHSDRFQKTVSDQRGRFSLHGIAPGKYSLFAWENVDGDAYYDSEFLKNYEQQATSLRIVEGDRKSVQLQVIPTAEPQ
jgi:hypothetical protein